MNNWKIEDMAKDIVLTYFNMDENLANAIENRGVGQYRGRLIFDSKQRTVDFINLIDWLNIAFGLSGQFVAKVIIEEYSHKVTDLS